MPAPTHTIRPGSDAHRCGLWDKSRDRDPLPTRRGLVDLEVLQSDSAAGHLLQIRDVDEVAIYLEAEPDAAAAELTIPVDGPRLLRAPSGLLCLSGIEDYRRRKPFFDQSELCFEVPPGDYEVRVRELDDNVPARRLRAELGAEDFECWKESEGQPLGLSCWFLILGSLAGLAAAWRYSWWLVLPTLILAFLCNWWFERRADPEWRIHETWTRFHEFTGLHLLSEYEEQFWFSHPQILLILRRLVDEEERPEAGKPGGLPW